MENNLKRFLLTSALTANLLLPTTALAQSNLDMEPGVNMNQPGNIQNQTPIVTDDNQGFNWLWLLPLILLPLAFLIWPKGEDKREERETTSSTYREDVAYHDIDKDETKGEGQGWHGDLEEHSQAAKREEVR